MPDTGSVIDPPDQQRRGCPKRKDATSHRSRPPNLGDHRWKTGSEECDTGRLMDTRYCSCNQRRAVDLLHARLGQPSHDSDLLLSTRNNSTHLKDELSSAKSSVQSAMKYQNKSDAYSQQELGNVSLPGKNLCNSDTSLSNILQKSRGKLHHTKHTNSKRRKRRILPFSLVGLLRQLSTGTVCDLIRSALLVMCVMACVVATPALEMPPRYSRDSMPNTSFTCDDKASGGYYADPEAECQVFHVCVRVSEDEIRDHKFLCPNDTIFDQQNFICASWWDTDCKNSKDYYSKNDLFRVNDPWATPAPPTTTTTPVPEPQSEAESDLYYEYLLDYEEYKKPSLTDQYDYQYYDSITRYTGKRGRSHPSPDNNFYQGSPPLARSVSESSGSLNNLSSSKGYVISTKLGSHSTPKPIVMATSAAETTLAPFGAFTTERIERTTVPSTNKQISTTKRSVFKYPFEASFAVGKPVVSVSSTSSRLEVSSPRYAHSTPQYGYFSVEQPSTTPSYKTRSTRSSTSQPITETVYTTPATKTTTEIEQIYKQVKEFKAEDLESYSDSEDPFANIDWKKHPSSVTSTTKTRYETSFGPRIEEKRQLSTLFPIGRRRTTTPKALEIVPFRKVQQKSTSVTSSSSSSVGSSTYVTARRTNRNPRTRSFITGRRQRDGTENLNTDSKPRRIFSGPSRQDFSNFRYFKTAFGHTESPKAAFTRPNRSRQTSTRPADSLFSRRSSSSDIASDVPAKTASRNTRYSIYA